MSDTPISDSTPHNVADLGMLCRRLEREFNTAQQRIKRLEEALDEVYHAGRVGASLRADKAWNKAKEAKP
jgi:hypothetical protein